MTQLISQALPSLLKQVLVTDGLWRKSLSAVRSLGKAGFHVSVMGDSVFTSSFWSRFTHTRIFAPLASANPQSFGRHLLQFLESRNTSKTVILPMEDASLEWVAQALPQIEKAGGCVLIPDWKTIQIAQDKGQTLQAARRLDIPCPQTWEPKTAQEFAKQIQSQTQVPLIVKPRSASGSHGFASTAQKENHDWENHWKQFGPMLIQEKIPSEGRGLGVSLLFDRQGECIASFAHERIQQYPTTGGPSTYRKSILAPELIEISIRLLKSLEWRGIAMVEWKIDPRDQVPKLMEINPRFWGSLELAIRSGVDFPALYARAALGEKISPQTVYRSDVECRWMMPGEILRYLSQDPKERESLPSFLKGLPQIAEEWDPRDLPGFFSALLCVGALAFNPKYWKYARSRG